MTKYAVKLLNKLGTGCTLDNYTAINDSIRLRKVPWQLDELV